MAFNFLPHPPNAAWLPPLDPNDQETLQQQQAMIQQQFKTILSQDLTGALGTIELRQEQQQQEQQEQDGDELQDYVDGVNLPQGQEDI